MENIHNPQQFRAYLDLQYSRFPQIFPHEFADGYLMKETRESKKLKILIRRIEVAGISYTIRPSYVLPYMTGFTSDVETAMFLRKFTVPFWALAHIYGRNPMYWFRIEQQIGKNSIVGTTIQDKESLSEHLGADEKHTKIAGDKCYVATTTAQGCILGASIAMNAGNTALTVAYGEFKYESQMLDPDYEPATVNTDGWPATQNAWTNLFPAIFIICCFLHLYIKMRNRSKKKHKELFQTTADKLWDCYNALTKRSFSQRVRRLAEWAEHAELPSVLINPIKKLKTNIKLYSVAYDHPGSHRTSNMTDRLMQRMHKYLYSTQNFHGELSSAELGIRGWVLINNFAPWNPFTVKKHGGVCCSAEKLNGFRYHDNWLQNLYISASLGGFRRSPPNPL
jgi:hypothetical protein